jgi:molecular chaperone DnaK (HSP70)
MKLKLGIDLGTYNSSAAVAVQRDNVVMVTSKEGKSPDGKNFPSFVQFASNGSKVSVGVRAKRSLALDPSLVVWGVKRLVGLSFQAALDRGETKRFQYNIERGPGDSILIRVGNERFTPSHILETILREIKEDAENQDLNPLFGTRFDEAVISIPAYYKAIRTAPILDAARQAGFKEVNTIAEPTAAALKYGLQIDREAVILSFDLGAGTLDVTVLQVVQDGANLVSGELCTSGHEALGGLDMDVAIRDFLIAKYKEIALASDKDRALFLDEVEMTKIRLSKAKTAKLLFANSEINLRRGELEEALSDILKRFRGPIQMAIKEAGLEASDIDHVLLVGGPTHIPCVRQAVRRELALLGAKQQVLAEIDGIDQKGFPVNPMECVSQGAALKAAGIISPASTSIAEGYGVVVASDRGSHYDPIIRENSMYPIEGKVSLAFTDPNAKTVGLGLVAKIADPDNYSESKPVFRYEHLGQYSLSVLPTGDLHSVELALRVSRDKALTATLTQEGTDLHVTYKSPDLLKNDIVQLLDGGKIPNLDATAVKAMSAKFDRGRSAWTRQQVEDCVLMAIRLLRLADNNHHQRIRKGVKALELSVSAVSDNAPEGAATLANSIREFLDLLRQPEFGVIKMEEFRQYLEDLTRITN